MNPNVLLVIITSYLLGSLPSAYLIAKLRHVDIFRVGSGNMGATNISRALGIKWGLLVWFLDSAKGIIAVSLAWQFIRDNLPAATTIAAFAAIIGHNWSLFATLITGSLRGGKGAATAFGTLLMVAPLQTLVIGIALSGAIIYLTRYISLGVLFMFSLSLTWIAVLTLQNKLPVEFIFYAFSTAGLILLRFRENIGRLAKGTERRLGDPV